MEKYIEKNKKTRIYVEVSEFKGKTFLSIREFFYSQDEDKWFPTQKGVTLPLTKINELVELINNTVLD